MRGRVAKIIRDEAVKLAMMPDAYMDLPYHGAKEMLLVDTVDDQDFLKELLEAMYPELPAPKKKRIKKN